MVLDIEFSMNHADWYQSIGILGSIWIGYFRPQAYFLVGVFGVEPNADWM